MANILYNKGLHALVDQAFNQESGVMRILLVRSTSTYTPNKDHDFVSQFTSGGGIEITVASYARQTLGAVAVTEEDADDLVKTDANNVAFGNLETGQTVKAYIVYFRVGADDTTPEDDILFCYVDEDLSDPRVLPQALGNGPFSVNFPTAGVWTLQQGTL